MRNELLAWNLLETCWELHFYDEEDGLYAIHVLGFRSDIIREKRQNRAGDVRSLGIVQTFA